MSVSASIGGPVPPPPPGPAAALPPGSAARALHVELPSQQVNPRARGARKGIRGRRAVPVPAGDPEKWPGELGGLTRAVRRFCKGRDPVMAEPLGDPAVRGEIPLLELGCVETGRDPVKLPGRLSPPVPPVGQLGIPLRRPSPYPPRNGPGEALVSLERQGQRFSFLNPLAENPVSTLSYGRSEESLRFLTFTFNPS